MCRVRWQLCGPLADCVEIARDARNPAIGSNPYMIDGRIDPIADHTLVDLLILSIAIEQNDLKYAEHRFIEAHLAHVNLDDDEG
ncbi:hypothetical protein K461DRAFT_274002, partial [Myriangium duriaei CBS 260.36]